MIGNIKVNVRNKGFFFNIIFIFSFYVLFWIFVDIRFYFLFLMKYFELKLDLLSIIFKEWDFLVEVKNVKVYIWVLKGKFFILNVYKIMFFIVLEREIWLLFLILILLFVFFIEL